MKSLFAILDRSYQQKSDIPAFYYVDAEEKRVTVSAYQFALDVRRGIGCLTDRFGDLAQCHIAVIARNSYDYLVCMYAILGAGAVLVPLNIEKSFEEISSEIHKADVKYLLHDGEYCQREAAFAVQYEGRLMRLNDYRSSVSEKEWSVRFDPDALAMIMFTSGTTGISKGVCVKQSAMEENALAFATFFEEAEKRLHIERMNFLSCLPLYHIYQFGAVTACITAGFEVSICQNVRNLLRDIEMLECNYAALVPVMMMTLSRLIKAGQKDRLGFLKEFMCAGALCPPEVFELFLNNGFNITNDYGLTEMDVVTINTSDDFYTKTHSVGKPFGDTAVSIEDGEVLLKGASLTSGYYNNPEETALAIRDGWFHTGDLGYVNEGGYLFLTGRKKNVIILSSGENVSPEELEGLLTKCEQIKEMRVKEKNGAICAEIFCAEEDRDTIRAFVQEVNRSVALYKRITVLDFTADPLPKTGSGKIKRY